MPTEKKELEKLVKTWKGKKGTLIMILHEIQNQYGYIPEDVSLKLANLLDIPLARIYEVITFYHYFKLNPPGKCKINICMGTACYLKGAPDLIDEIKDLLNIDEGETTKDGLFQLESVRCLGCCGLAPVMTINDKVYGNVKKQDLQDILATYTKEEKK
jgi:NADH-quinone oxidoreductase subunit E